MGPDRAFRAHRLTIVAYCQRISATPTPVAEGVWRITRGFPLKINVFLIREGDGVAIFDAGSRNMGTTIRAAADTLGGATRVVLGNAHADHRGGAHGIGAPVHCHADDRADAESDGGEHYFDFGLLPLVARPLLPRVLRGMDGGPVQIVATVAEGDLVGDFEVVHLPGHSPGCIGLWRASDGLALCNDSFTLFHPMAPFPGRRARVPHAAVNWSTERAHESAAKLAALAPAIAWPAHFGPITGDVAAQLRAAYGSPTRPASRSRC